MSSDLDCRAPRARACANLVPIPRALKKLYGATLKQFLIPLLEHGHTHSANQCPAFRCSIFHKLS